jgi:hypothetical protein
MYSRDARSAGKVAYGGEPVLSEISQKEEEAPYMKRTLTFFSSARRRCGCFLGLRCTSDLRSGRSAV